MSRNLWWRVEIPYARGIVAWTLDNVGGEFHVDGRRGQPMSFAFEHESDAVAFAARFSALDPKKRNNDA